MSEDFVVGGEPAPTWHDILRLMRTWWVGLDTEYKGVNLADCLSFDLVQIVRDMAGLAK